MYYDMDYTYQLAPREIIIEHIDYDPIIIGNYDQFTSIEEPHPDIIEELNDAVDLYTEPNNDVDDTVDLYTESPEPSNDIDDTVDLYGESQEPIKSQEVKKTKKKDLIEKIYKNNNK